MKHTFNVIIHLKHANSILKLFFNHNNYETYEVLFGCHCIVIISWEEDALTNLTLCMKIKYNIRMHLIFSAN